MQLHFLWSGSWGKRAWGRISIPSLFTGFTNVHWHRHLGLNMEGTNWTPWLLSAMSLRRFLTKNRKAEADRSSLENDRPPTSTYTETTPYTLPGRRDSVRQPEYSLTTHSASQIRQMHPKSIEFEICVYLKDFNSFFFFWNYPNLFESESPVCRKNPKKPTRTYMSPYEPSRR